MSSDLDRGRALEDWAVDFRYGYRMTCECGGVTRITAEVYHDEPDEARVPCEHCSRPIHFGRAVAALRDDDDPALDNARINTLAWYHTSTAPDWPAWNAEARRAELAEKYRHVYKADDRGPRLIDKELNKALHVGTYEAAIENMYRRIRNQQDDPTAFYLYRVALNIDPRRVDGGYRDENHQPAAQLTTMDLRAQRLEAVRYLNVHEATGSLSLAILPETVASVQCVSLPVFDLAPVHGAPLVDVLDRLQAELDAPCAAEPDTPGTQLSALDMLRLRRGRDVASARGRRVGGLSIDLKAALCKEYLVGVSPVVADAFTRAIGWQPGWTARQFADFFAASAVAVTRPGAVVALLAGRESRRVTS